MLETSREKTSNGILFQTIYANWMSWNWKMFSDHTVYMYQCCKLKTY